VSDDRIFTSTKGVNADQFPGILKLYARPGGLIIDLTYSAGRFWQQVPDHYNRIAIDIKQASSDLSVVADLRWCPIRSGVANVVVLDPPYAKRKSSKTKASLSDTYNLESVSDPNDIADLYQAGIATARRILHTGGKLIMKCQDEIESGKQHWHHITLKEKAEAHGFMAEDLFVLMQQAVPIKRWDHQLHARKNHSYWWVFIQ